MSAKPFFKLDVMTFLTDTRRLSAAEVGRRVRAAMVSADAVWLVLVSPSRRDRISPKVRARVFARSGGFCTYCPVEIIETAFDIDHVVPLSKGGADDEDNLVAACPRCNRSKGAKTLAEWVG